MWVIRAVPPGAQPSLSSLGCSRAALINHHTTDGIDFFFSLLSPPSTTSSIFLFFSVPPYLLSISAASLPYTTPIIVLEQCQPPSRGPRLQASPSVLLLRPWSHLLNTILVSESVESHCRLTKEMWDWFLAQQIKLKFPFLYMRACVHISVWKKEESRFFSLKIKKRGI